MTVLAETKHKLANSKFVAKNLYICRDTAVFVTRLHGTAIAKTALFMCTICDRDVGHQSAITPIVKAFHSFNVSGKDTAICITVF